MDKIILEKLIKAHDGDVALLYIYLLCHGENKLEQIAIDLCMTVKQVEIAKEKLNLMGIYSSITQNTKVIPSSNNENLKLEPIIESKNYTSNEIIKAGNNEQFDIIKKKLTHVLGRVIGKDDLEKLMDIYANLEMPLDVIYILLSYCEKISSNRKPTMNFIVKQAYNWYGMEIRTADEAEKYSDKMCAQNLKIANIKKVLGINDRDLRKTEYEYIEKWINLGYTINQIEQADDITYTKTGKRAWQYMDTVLANLGKNKTKANETKKGPKPLPNPNDIVKKQKG